MRIISGALRGKHIAPPARFNARPTTDFAKESLFNILDNAHHYAHSRALDLFAGTGSISYELASRGCPHIDAVEMNPLHHRFIKQTALRLNLPQIHAIKMNVFDFIAICTVRYPLVFADPPYDLQGIEALPDTIITKNILADNGLFILEHAGNIDFSQHPGFKEHRRYGAVNFSFFTS